MPSMSNITLVGRMVRDAELHENPNKISFARFSVAVDGRKDRDTGEKKTSFFDVKVFGPTAKFVTDFGGKGRLITVAGSVDVEDYTTQQGEKRRSITVNANSVDFLDRKDDEGGEGGGGNGGGGGYQQAQPRQQPQARIPAPQSQTQRPATRQAPAAAPAEDDDDGDPFGED